MKLRFSLLLVLLAATAAWARNAPDFTLPDSDGRQVTLSSYRGKYVVLEFMLTTCPHCQAAGKTLEALQTEFPEHLQVLALSTGPQGVVGLSDYKKEFNVNYPVLQAGGGYAGQKVLMDYLGINPINPAYRVPIFFLISPTGEILQEKNPDHLSDKGFYENPDPKANAADTGDVWLQKNVEAMVRQALPAKKAAPAAEKSRKSAPAAKKTQSAPASAKQ